VLAAGEGRGMFPYDLTRQKAALPVGNRPLIARTVEHLRAAGCREIAVVVGYRQERVRQALRDVDGISFVVQAQRSGTAPATMLGLEQVAGDDPVVVVYGDALIGKEELAAFVTSASQTQPLAAAMVAPLGEQSALDWLCAGVSGDRLTGVSGHPRGATHRLCGCYVFSPEATRFIAANPGVMDSVNVGGMPAMEGELAQSVGDMIEAGHEVLACENKGLFCDLDRPWHLLEANEKWTARVCGALTESRVHPTARIHDGAEIAGHVVLGQGSVVGNRVVVRGSLVVGANATVTNGAIVDGPTIVGDRARLRDYCVAAGVIGADSVVAHGAEFWGTLFRKVYLYHYCELCGVFGEAVDIGAATVCGTLRFDDGDTVHNVRGRHERPECNANDTYMGDYSRTGVNAVLMPGVKIGAYSCVGPGVIAYDDIPHKTMVLAKQQLTHKPWGPEKYGW
jgi:bifunctional UDP-N-acetylglucosamine pyrophosphorylase/glucosamine-1-phosphate N-acetyltransferase